MNILKVERARDRYLGLVLLATIGLATTPAVAGAYYDSLRISEENNRRIEADRQRREIESQRQEIERQRHEMNHQRRELENLKGQMYHDSLLR